MHPIQHEPTRNRLLAQWKGLLQMHGTAQGPDTTAQTAPFVLNRADVQVNLLMIIAFNTLNDVLRAYVDQDIIQADDLNPITLLRASQDALPWTEFHLLNEGIQLCERVFLYQTYVNRTQASMYIHAIENEFKRWQPFAAPSEPANTDDG